MFGRFIQAKCLPVNPHFETWAELLYVRGLKPIRKPSEPMSMAVGANSLRKLDVVTSSMEGSIIRSHEPGSLQISNDILPMATNEPKIVQKIRLKPLYSEAIHHVRFSCAAIGPAGWFKVRISTNVSSNPVLLESAEFLVEWTELFSIDVPRANIIPCLTPVSVFFNRPVCSGAGDKIRLFAHVRTNVTSANPPIQEK